MKKLFASMWGYCCLVASLLLFAACSKTGATGATGAAGATGATGATGASGVQGPAGSSILSGNGAPADTTGKIGDFYIDLTAIQLYGPKTTSGWGTSVSLKGTPGATGYEGTNGKAGSQIYRGSGAPALSLGNAGDYYMDELNDSLYGPKTASGWGTGISLRGSQGPAGTANVIYYSWTAFTPANWSAFDPTSASRTYSISMPEITEDLFDEGVVLVYLNCAYYSPSYISSQDMTQLPANFYNRVNGNKREMLEEHLQPGSLTLALADAQDNGDPGTLFSITGPPAPIYYMYRVIIIPGGVLGTGIDPQQLTYQQVCTRFNIQP
jgi:hypothetical protein